MKRLLILTDAPIAPLYIPRIRYLVRNLYSRGWECTVVSEKMPDSDFVFSDCRYIGVEYYGKHNRLRWWMDQLFGCKEKAFYRYVRGVLAEEPFDAILCSVFNTFPLPSAARLARERNLSLYADLRDIAEQWGETSNAQSGIKTRWEWFNRAIERLYRHRAIRRRDKALKQAQAITTVSPWHKQFLQGKHPNVRLIYNGYDEQTFVPQDVKTEEFVISYTGRIYDFRLRDPQLLFAAIDDLRAENRLPKELRVDFYTDEREAAMLKTHYPSDVLRIHPFVKNEEIANILRHSSISLILTNKTTDKGPHGIMTTKFFEALGVEKPVLCVRSDEECLAAVIRDTNAGLAATNVEEVKAFILEKYAEWKANGFTRQAVKNKEQFSRQYQASQFEELFAAESLINIIVPAYNAEKYLAECLCSIKNQSYPNWRCIIVDDGSTDNTAGIAQAFTEADKRFELLRQKQNAGQSVARNQAMKLVRSGYVAFVDADDWLDKDYLERLSEIRNADIVQCGYKRMTDDGKVRETKLPRNKYQFTVPWGRLYQSKLLQDVRFPERIIYEDVVFSLQLWAKRPKVTIIPYIGYNYRLNPASTTAHKNHSAQEKLYQAIQAVKAPLWLKKYTLLRLKLHFRK